MGWKHKLAIVSMLWQTSCPSIDSALTLYGYMPLTPPSVLLQPGTMLFARKGGIFGVVCGPRASLGAHWKPHHSPTSSSELKRVRGQNFKVTGDVLEQIRANAQFNAVRSIIVTVDDANLVEINDTDVIENIQYRSGACREAIKGRIANGYAVTMVSSGLRASLTYRVTWDASAQLDAKARLDTMQALSAELGGGATCVDETAIRATNLMIGIRDDTYLARISAPDVIPERAHHEAILTTHQIKSFDPTPQAPIVPYQPKDGSPPSEHLEPPISPVAPKVGH
jgi:hypothetical protein